MSTLGIINSDPQIKSLVKAAFAEIPLHNYDLHFLTQKDEILEFLNFTLPELLIVNLSDSQVDVRNIAEHIKNDKWMLNFGIVGLYFPEKDKEEDLIQKYKAINILALLDNFRIKSHLVKNIQIIEENYQIIFQREFTKNFLERASGSFIIENDIMAVTLYSSIGASILAQRGLIDPDHKTHLQLALAELIVNAIEHGNCGITYEEKTKALNEGIAHTELIAQKCRDPKIKARRVTFSWELRQDSSMFIIQDDGDGFDVKKHIEKMGNQEAYSLHGRGIAMAARFSNGLKYNAKGNKAALIIKYDPSVEHEVPAGLINERIIHVKTGDIVIKEGDPSNNLYYISSGTFDVLHKGRPVGSLSSQDIFMGEMSFLLNQRRSATIKATSPGKLILLTHKTFVNVIRENPHYGVFLSKLLARRLVRTNEQAASASRLNILQK